MPKKSIPKRPMEKRIKKASPPKISKSFQRWKSFKYSFITTLIFALTALALWLSLLLLKAFIGFDLFNWFQDLPFIYPIAAYITTQIKLKTFEGLVYVFSLSSLFFIPSPLEVIFISYLTKSSSLAIVLVPAFFGIIIGQHFNFYVGRVFGSVIKKFINRKTVVSVQRRLRDYGAVSIFFINLLPLPYPITNFLAGSFRFPYGRWLLFTSLAIALKLVFIAWVIALFF